MNVKEFRELAESRVLFLDGATGSNLIKAGMPTGVCTEEWILDHQDILVDLQKKYVDSGSDFLYSPTFSGNRVKFKEFGLYDRIEEIIETLVSLSHKASNGRAFICGDLTMTGEQLKPMGSMDFEELIDIYKEQIKYMVAAGVDILVVETMMSLQETRAALIAAKETCDLPIMATISIESDGRTLYGTDAVSAAVCLEALGASAVGLNCSTGPDKMVAYIKEIASNVNIPVIAKPNAGLPSIDKDGNTYYDMGVDEFVEGIGLLLDAGASIIGGCCGTSPEYIKAIHDAYKDYDITKVKRGKTQGTRYLTSERKTLSFRPGDPFIVVGERINPTGKKKLQEQLRNNNLEGVVTYAEEQEECGAKVLDVNVGMSGVDELTLMSDVLDEVLMASSLPLSLDSSDPKVMEMALRKYPGRALINSVSLEEDRIPVLKLAKKYGAMVILLPLSAKGIPETFEERKENVDKLIELAYEAGLTKEDLVVDGLVGTVGAVPTAAIDTLKTIKYCTDMGISTICGLSNISFGLPERSFVNSNFLTMAIHSGLTMAIANPSQTALMGAAFASDLLLNRRGASENYINFAGSLEGEDVRSIKKESAPKAGSENESDIKAVLYNAVMKGNRNAVEKITRDALDKGEDAKVILNDVLMPAINKVGELFEKGKYFLPQLINSAETMKLSIAILEDRLLSAWTGKQMPTVIMATVEGDVHDIGKNLVVLMLKNYGFNVIDLGKNVSKETIIEAAAKYDAKVVGLSALMTTTMQKMKEVVDYRNEVGADFKIMIGGAVVTEEYAAEIGADAYSSDASDAVKVAARLLNLSL
ncbi:MAG: homocysteine S-methyltransferase family protein [Lachnospiraceae bacterium]|nr:homocysteine S-methyltransferase family protein [Lachnospiraceae bacterium]MBP5299721.1 homocysteine S-methyltransferase family protein [Lachnospiraceae bacterium]